MMSIIKGRNKFICNSLLSECKNEQKSALTHWHALIAAIALPRTYSATLCMYGVNEIASYRRISSCIN